MGKDEVANKENIQEKIEKNKRNKNKKNKNKKKKHPYTVEITAQVENITVKIFIRLRVHTRNTTNGSIALRTNVRPRVDVNLVL